MYSVHGFFEAARITRTRPVRDINVYCHLLVGTDKTLASSTGACVVQISLVSAGVRRESPRLRRAPVPHHLKLTTSQHHTLSRTDANIEKCSFPSLSAISIISPPDWMLNFFQPAKNGARRGTIRHILSFIFHRFDLLENPSPA
jgi:hypothetical protein